MTHTYIAMRGRRVTASPRRGLLRRHARKVAALGAVAVMLWWHREPGSAAATVMFVLSGCMLLVILALATVNRHWSDRPLPAGFVACVVPVFNEDPARLRACIESLLAQSRPPEVIHVVDDGSVVPAERYEHPRVTWVRTENQGKRHAQITGLGTDLYLADFILTVDSDSTFSPDAVYRLMQAFDEPRVMAATGMQVVANRTESLVTRVTDLEMVYSEMTMRKARSTLGAVCPCAGPLAMYRAGVIADNVDDYLTSGTFSDDRRLAHYALGAGHVVQVRRAVVHMHMPPTARGAFLQRTRWFKGAWMYAPWEARNLRGAPLALRAWNITAWIAYPIVIIWAVVVLPALGRGVDWTPFAYWLALLYVQSAAYVTARPGVGWVDRFATWLLLTPALSLWQTLVVRPAMYYALTQLRSTSWGTRGVAVPQRAVLAADAA